MIWFKFSKIVLASILGLDCKMQTEAGVPVERQDYCSCQGRDEGGLEDQGGNSRSEEVS